jgi:uncharacterized protein (TIGR00661 family)
MGHAARLVPIANHLNKNGYRVFICANGAALKLMQLECPYATFVDDIPLEITYSKNSLKTALKLLLKLPLLLKHVYDEHQLLKKIVQEHNIDLILSDNRYGLYHTKVPCIFITHQLHIHVPFGGSLVNFLNHYFIKKFNECWIPDYEQDSIALAGKLSRNHQFKNVKYIGILSRFAIAKSTIDSKAPVLYLLSGVEPQRSMLEKMILKRHAQLPHQAILIRGSNNTNEVIKPKHNLIVYEICDAKQLQNLVAACKYVVCRSGYSSVMDVVRWQKNALIIPTPGQFEQIYLAQYLSDKKWFYTLNQELFDGFNEENMKSYQCPANIEFETDFEAMFANF